jgi:uncharacterized protein (TIGR03435 family)
MCAFLIPIAIASYSSAQTAPPPAFEVATVRQMDAKKPHPPSVMISGDQFEANGMTLKDLIKVAYDLNYGADKQVTGGPAWTASEQFDIEAKEDGALSEKLKKLPKEQRGVQLRQMLRDLLAERFGLQLHHETSELPVYELAIAKNGPKLTPAPSEPIVTKLDSATRPRNLIRVVGKGQIEARDADTPMLVTLLCTLPEIDGRLVVDKTGLTGKYDFTLSWTPDTGQPADPSSPDAGPSLFTALQEELGLKLEPKRTPVDMIVIDRAELPTAN